jgi:regulator of protease activity HflC (stomatin/prohibitin superfamily)
MVTGYFAAVMTIIMAKFAMGRTRLEKRRLAEEQELEAYRRSHGTTDLFGDADEAVRLAARASEQYLKYFIPVATVLLGLILLGVSLNTWRDWSRLLAFPVAAKPLAMAAISLALSIIAIIASSYFIGVSRETGCRWLRPAGSWMFFTGMISLANAVVLACEHFGRWTEVIDIRVARVIMVILIILAAELIFSVIIEFYRPRMPGEPERPLPESRLLALFTEPGGVARNIAASLDYQFGFRVSEARFYRFLERIIVPFLLLLVLLLWFQTCLVVVKTDENGLRETFGRISPKPLAAGAYLKLPTPFERIHRFPVHRVQRIPLGYSEQENAAMPDEHEGPVSHEVIIWSRRHRQNEAKYIVASKLAGESLIGGEQSGEKAPVSVYSLSADVPLYFRVRDLFKYRYGHRDATKTLQLIASREIVHYLSAVDFFAVLTGGRQEGAEFLKQRIQSKADELGLGIEVVFVGLQGLHPPVEVGGKFDEVAAASEEREEIILKAETYQIQNVMAAVGEQFRIVSAAEAYRVQQMSEPAAIADRFLKQLVGYESCPQVFILYNLLDVLETEGAQVRKYIVAADSSNQVYILDLLEKTTSGLLDIPVGGAAETNGNQ